MDTLHLSDILDHWVVGRTRALLEPNARTLKQMSHLPPHLVDDVNARGFPPDVTIERDASGRLAEMTRRPGPMREKLRFVVNHPDK